MAWVFASAFSNERYLISVKTVGKQARSQGPRLLEFSYRKKLPVKSANAPHVDKP